MDEAMILAAAQAISRTLTDALADAGARTIQLTRDEALLTLGLVNGVAEQLARELP